MPSNGLSSNPAKLRVVSETLGDEQTLHVTDSPFVVSVMGKDLHVNKKLLLTAPFWCHFHVTGEKVKAQGNIFPESTS